jgi:hypothetical protein
MPASSLDQIRDSVLAFLFILVEFALGTFLFYFVIYIERNLGGLSGVDQNGDAALYWFGFVGKILLLIVDFAITFLFVGHGLRGAYQQTWGKG